jgi:hypothetical protein
LNTSAFIEAGIAGRPVLAIMPPEFRANQEGTLHFRYLTQVGGGLLTTSRSLDEHEGQLQAILAGDAAAILERQRQFVRDFVRPHGLDTAATPLLAQAIEQLPAESGAIATARRPSPGAALALRALEAMQHSPRWRGLLLDERELRSAATYEEKRRRTDAALARKAAERAEKAERRARRAS